jgi:predicted Zn-dependent protease
MLKENIKFVVFGIILILQPVFLAGQIMSGGQANSLFSTMDRIFSDEQTLTPEEEYYLGRAVAANIFVVYKPYTANTELTNYLNLELTNYLNLICQALVINSAQPAVYNGYHVVILDSRELNAFSTPGGHVFITKGLIDIVPSEDALAGIIAHELAHIMLKHGLKMIDGFKIVWEMDAMAGQAASFSGNEEARVVSFRNSVDGIFDVMIKSGFSQPQESEADTLVVKLLTVAGYSPDGLLEMLNVLKTVQNSQSGGIFASHPATNERIANVQRQITPYKTADNSFTRRERFLRIMGRVVR